MMKEMLTNRILTGLADGDFVRLMPSLEPVSLFAGERLTESGEHTRFIYFPENSVISCHADMQDGKSAEIGMIGRDGMTGLTALLGCGPTVHSLNVVMAGSALRIRKDELERELGRGESLSRALLLYTGEYLTQVSQRVACAILHRMEQRLAVWLLMLTARLGSETVEITQERIAQHLGVRRAGITEIAGELQQRGVISYTRGNLCVADRAALESVACECYAALTQAGQKNTYR